MHSSLLEEKTVERKAGVLIGVWEGKGKGSKRRK